MPPNSFARLLTPTALGVALLGLSAVLFAIDVGGTVALDAPSAGPASAPASGGEPAENSVVAEANSDPRVLPEAVPSIVPVATAEAPASAPAPRAVLRVSMKTAAPVPRVARTHGLPPAKHASVIVGKGRSAVVAATRRPAAPVRIVHSIPVAPPVAAVAVVRAPAKPHTVAAIADLRDVRRYAMSKLVKRYPHASVISADTYAVGGGRVRVAMVVRSGNQRWVERDEVRRSGANLSLLASARHAMPYAVAQTAAAPAPDPDPAP
jgi:hypothetical protein